MLDIIQIIIVAYFCSVICFLDRPNHGATLSLRAYRRRAQDSQVMVVSLLKCRPHHLTCGNTWMIHIVPK